MKDLVRTLKSSLQNATGSDFGALLRSRGVADFLLDCDQSTWNAEETAARMLVELTVGDLGLLDQKVCLAAVEFLDQVRGQPEKALLQQKLKDLKALLLEKAELGEFINWARGWYS